MKKSVAIKTIQQTNDFCFVASLPKVHDIFRGIEPRYYNAGTYGWNCDIWEFVADDGTTCAVMAGYRNTRGVQVPAEIETEFTRRAAGIEAEYTRRLLAREFNGDSWEWYSEQYAALRRDFVRDLCAVAA